SPLFRDATDSLRSMADSTDGLAIVETNDLNTGMRRIVEDLSAYYLIGYYSSGKLDGKFHKITVRVKRPGVSVRARRGYLAATPATATASARGNGGTADAGAAARAAEAHTFEAVVGPLAGYTRDVPLRLQAAAGWKPDGAAAALWVVGEL